MQGSLHTTPGLRAGTLVLPDDAPFASVPGPDSDRVLVLGDAVAAAGGTDRHADALIGRLAVALATRSGRGVVVDEQVTPDCRAEDLAGLADGVRLDRYDAVVVVPGSADAAAFVAVSEWSRSLTDLIGRIRGASRETFVVVSGRTRPTGDRRSGGLRGTLSDVRAKAMDRAAAELARTSSGVAHVAPPPSGKDAGTSALFDGWADDLAAALMPALSSAAAQAVPPVADPEEARLNALAATGLVGSGDDRFDGLAVRAKELMDADLAAVTFLDADTQWFQAMEGAEYTSVPRSISLCNSTIAADGPVVYGDMHLDRALDAHPLVHGDPPIRFYAGAPLLSPSGYRIGTVCVFGVRPRDPGAVDLAPLQRLADEARDRIWAAQVGR